MAVLHLLQTPLHSFSRCRTEGGKFDLSAVSEVRNKIAKACDWTNGSVDEPVGSIEQEEKR